ncbi:protocadherin fat 4 [Plakobranchus ocellatus]|uniref:Protocadherin fat 4 n=1 Tax=Plakobranchus ocellatus TaxID=259542 RepID=A0AAV3Z512_9GAST|nr:protocadherin fat 4 [Plakobranchus ocellatus]
MTEDGLYRLGTVQGISKQLLQQLYVHLVRDPCVHFRCENGGKCTAPTDKPYCVCLPGYSGYHCELKAGMVDQCGGCPMGEVCKATGIVCITSPCPTHKCEVMDKCGGCPAGQTCHMVYPPCPLPPDCSKWSDPVIPCPKVECDPIPMCS